MKKFMKSAMFLALGTFAMTNLASCDSDDPEVTTGGDEELQAIAQQYVDGTVNETYKLLADSTSQLFDKLMVLKNKAVAGEAITQDEIDDVCDVFIKARSNYETSEAFLYGAATDFGIDPHIDTWPLDRVKLAASLSNPEVIKGMDSKDDEGNYAGDQYAWGQLGQESLGFHGIEFILFRNGKNREAKYFNNNMKEDDAAFAKVNVTAKEELIFATAVAGDLRNNCWQMEVAWNQNAPASHKSYLEDVLEWPVAMQNGKSYTQNMLGATVAGSTYATWREVISDILIAGCQNIANEVAMTKMGKPYNGEDKNYIESPYSHRSFYDFTDNVKSIEFSYYGGRPDKRNESKSLHAYLAKHNPALDKKVVDAINASLSALAECRKVGPFVTNIENNTGRTEIKAAIDAINGLSNTLIEANDWISKN